MKWIALFVTALFLSACVTPSTQSIANASLYKVIVQENRSCEAVLQSTEVPTDTITGVDADGEMLSFWTPSLTGVSLAVSQATEMCGKINPEDVTVTYPDYRCQVRIDIDMENYQCVLPQ